MIERELRACQHFIAILSPAAVTSEWVNAEIDAALAMLNAGVVITFQIVTAVPCEVPLLLQRYKRIERSDGTGYPPAEAAKRALAAIDDKSLTEPGVPAARDLGTLSAQSVQPESTSLEAVRAQNPNSGRGRCTRLRSSTWLMTRDLGSSVLVQCYG